MSYKEVRFKTEAQVKVLRGAAQLADAVRITLGPKSHSVLIQRKWGMRKSEGNVGFDAARKVYVDLMQTGIIDPAKVVRVALENAVSVAGLLLLTQATITEHVEEKERPAIPMDESASLM